MKLPRWIVAGIALVFVLLVLPAGALEKQPEPAPPQKTEGPLFDMNTLVARGLSASAMGLVGAGYAHDRKAKMKPSRWPLVLTSAGFVLVCYGTTANDGDSRELRNFKKAVFLTGVGLQVAGLVWYGFEGVDDLKKIPPLKEIALVSAAGLLMLLQTQVFN